jgi:predicted nucleotidyltransferase
MTDLSQLSPEERELILTEITQTIVRLRSPEKVILFGSLVSDNPAPDSDVDLVIIQETDLDFFERTRGLRSYLMHLRVPMDIIVFTPAEWERQKDRVGWLAYEVNRTGRVLYESGRE